MARNTAGSMLATRIFFPPVRFSPMQKIRIEPIRDKCATAGLVQRVLLLRLQKFPRETPDNSPENNAGAVEKGSKSRHFCHPSR